MKEDFRSSNTIRSVKKGMRCVVVVVHHWWGLPRHHCISPKDFVLVTPTRREGGENGIGDCTYSEQEKIKSFGIGRAVI